VEIIMSKTNDTPKPTPDLDGRLLRDEELEHVSGGVDLKGLSDPLTGKILQYKTSQAEGLGN
jgi:hypothetical protein